MLNLITFTNLFCFLPVPAWLHSLSVSWIEPMNTCTCMAYTGHLQGASSELSFPECRRAFVDQHTISKCMRERIDAPASSCKKLSYDNLISRKYIISHCINKYPFHHHLLFVSHLVTLFLCETITVRDASNVQPNWRYVNSFRTNSVTCLTLYFAS